MEGTRLPPGRWSAAFAAAGSAHPHTLTDDHQPGHANDTEVGGVPDERRRARTRNDVREGEYGEDDAANEEPQQDPGPTCRRTGAHEELDKRPREDEPDD